MQIDLEFEQKLRRFIESAGDIWKGVDPKQYMDDVRERVDVDAGQVQVGPLGPEEE